MASKDTSEVMQIHLAVSPEVQYAEAKPTGAARLASQKGELPDIAPGEVPEGDRCDCTAHH